ncbi:EamA family transporter [Antarcticirhabdus aurantiaca]|uniref:EamA family transporter n=1 Tax=Antarcticirhabdus aurantiaca TaxID=2606717 RepID=A0ACD4NN46_9HYPH|nr:EamA family transporter [Antarcticirhabdus aurantiaca]WAJ28296.1 EamA family transporter [Jeongeuplla avenae]
MSARATDIVLTALAPMIWGSTYLVTTSFLAGFPPLTVAMLRALPAGLLLLLIVRRLPWGPWWTRCFVLGALNFSLFWFFLFVAAYRLPGGVAATVGAVQPLIVILMARVALATPIRASALLAAAIGLLGVALLVLSPAAALDPVGVAAALIGTTCMAAGTVLTRRWQPPVPLVTFTAWQLAAGGLLLLPPVLFLEPIPAAFDRANALALAWIGLVGAAMTYILWFRGIARLEPSVVSSLGFLSPVTAILLGWLVLGETLSLPQILGIGMVIASIWFGQRAARARS